MKETHTTNVKFNAEPVTKYGSVNELKIMAKKYSTRDASSAAVLLNVNNNFKYFSSIASKLNRPIN